MKRAHTTENAIIADPSLSPSLSSSLSLLIQNNMGIVECARPSKRSASPPSFVSRFPHPRFCFPFNPFYFIFSSSLVSFHHSFFPHLNVVLSLRFSLSIFHSLMHRGNSLPPLRSLIHHHQQQQQQQQQHCYHPPPFFSLTFSHTHAGTLNTPIGMHKSRLHIIGSEQYRLVDLWKRGGRGQREKWEEDRGSDPEDTSNTH